MWRLDSNGLEHESDSGSEYLGVTKLGISVPSKELHTRQKNVHHEVKTKNIFGADTSRRVKTAKKKF
jgi:hypothetical protein